MPRKYKRIALLSAVSLESERILKHLASSRKPAPGLTTGRMSGIELIHFTSGPGMANAASGATMLIERYSPDVLIVLGIGGAYPGSGLALCDVAAATTETFAELGALTPEGFKSAEDIGLSTLTRGAKKFYETYTLDPALLKRAREVTSASGPFITVSTVTGTSRMSRLIMKRFEDALCENMEGAAAASVCTRYSVPMLEVRGISNMVEDRDKSKWEIRHAAQSCQQAVIDMIAAL